MGAFLSFVGGAASQFVSSVEQAEKDAKEMAKSSFNGLYKRYEENAEVNRELTNKMKAEKQYIETVWSNATPEQVNELLANPVALEAIKKTKNPSAVSLDNYIKVIKGNESKSTGAERAAVLPELVEQVKSQLQPKGGSPIGGFIRDVGKERMESDMEKYAKGMGISLEELRSAEKVKRPAGSATFDMSLVAEPVKWDDVKNQAKLAKFNADKEGDPAKIAIADKALEMALKADQGITDPQKQFANDLAKAKSVLTNPLSTSAQIKEANAFYDRFLALEKRESLAKKTGETKSESVPKLSTLNSHASGSVGSALTTQFGKAVSEGKITFSVNQLTGETTPNILLTDPAERLKVATAARDAARASLDNYIDPRTNQPLTTDVASALNRYEYALKIAQDEYSKSQAAKGAVKTDETKQTPAAAAPPAAAAKPAVVQSKPVQPSIDIRKERALADAAIKAQPQNAEEIKASFKARTKTDY